MFKKALIALSLCVGIQSAMAAMPPFNQKYEANGKPIAEKPAVARDFIEFRTTRGFVNDGFKSLDGKPMSLDQFKGKLVVVDVWASWSESCLRNIPNQLLLQKRFNKEGSKVQVISIALDTKPKRLNKFIKKHNATELLTWYDPDKILYAHLPVDVTPSTFVLDGNGHLIGFVRGYIDWSDPAVPSYFEKLAEKYADRTKKAKK